MPAPAEPRLPIRYDVEWAIEAAELPTVCKDVLFALARRMAVGTTWIPRQHCPSLRKLAEVSGWSKRHVLRALGYLEEIEVITRHRPTPYDARVRHVRTYYTVHHDRLAGLGTASPTAARDSQSRGLGPPRRKAGDTAPQELVTGSLEASGTVAPNQISDQPEQQSDPELAFIRRHIADRCGTVISDDHAARIRAVILARPGAQDMPSLTYIRRILALDKHPEKWLEEDE